MNEEIRLRTPSRRRSPIGSAHGLGVIVKRPSVGNILAQVPYLQQHLSEANLVTVCCISLKFSNKNTFNLGKEKYIRKSTKTVFFKAVQHFNNTGQKTIQLLYLHVFRSRRYSNCPILPTEKYEQKYTQQISNRLLKSNYVV